jgi:Glycosyltransferase family 87
MKTSVVPGSISLRGRLVAHPYTLLGVLLLLGFAIPFCLRKHSEWEEVYLRAAGHLRSGTAVYGPAESYLYPPLLAWLSIPFTSLTSLETRLAWYAVNVVSLVLLLVWSWQLAGGGALEGKTRVPRREHLIVLLGMACAIYYTLDCLTNQKCDLILGALMIGGCVALTRGRSFGAATLFGLAAGVRCTPLLWGPYLAWRGQWRAALWVGCVAIGVNFLPNLTSTPPSGGTWVGQWVVTYLAPLGNADRPPGEWGSEIKNNQSVSGAAARSFLVKWTREADGSIGSRNRAETISPALLNHLVHGCELALLLASLLVVGRHPFVPSQAPSSAERRQEGSASPERVLGWPRPALEFSVVLILMLLLSPMSSKTHYCVLFLPAFCVARLAVQRGDRFLWALLLGAIAMGVLSNKDLWGSTIYTLALWYGSVTWSALLLFLGCAYALLRDQESGVSKYVLTPDS